MTTIGRSIESVRLELERLFQEVNHRNVKLEEQKRFTEAVKLEFLSFQYELINTFIEQTKIIDSLIKEGTLIEVYPEWYQIRNIAEEIKQVEQRKNSGNEAEYEEISFVPR